MGERTHVTRALHVVLAAERVHPHAKAANVARRHRQIGHGHHHGRTLGVFGHTQAVINRTVARGGVGPRRSAQHLSVDAGDFGECLGAVLGQADEIEPGFERGLVAALINKVVVHEPFGGHHMRDRIEHRHVSAGHELQVVLRLNVRRAHQIDRARVDHDQICTLSQPALHARAEHGVRVGRVGADHHNGVGLLD